METKEAILSRRSHRRFTPEVLTEAEIHDLLNAGFSAPSAHNFHPLEFIVITQRELLNRLSVLLPYGKMLAEAPCAIAICGRPDLQPEAEFLIQDGAAAMENILLQAHGMGLGGVWIGVLQKSESTAGLKDALKVPDAIQVMSLCALGHPPFVKEAKDRYETHRVHRDLWTQNL